MEEKNVPPTHIAAIGIYIKRSFIPHSNLESGQGLLRTKKIRRSGFWEMFLDSNPASGQDADYVNRYAGADYF
ncbi:hypothetical protein CEXT_552611 [Caerostris extrusa]|uniref:Uncharacterized protein n=1 Tax=Caerostris extrusa TaxID=172846 RepID=A0AAV4UWE0_CAEEX|nr:hypothetical protein CEXT_552611 [Caerostris extrusa]